MDALATRIIEVLALPNPGLDMVMATIANIDDDAPPPETISQLFDIMAAKFRCDQEPQSTDAEPSDSPISTEVSEVMRFVHGSLGFSGDARSYYQPANSLIHRVIERRRGIPLTLAAINVEVARRVGVSLSVVGLPGHVVLGDGPVPTRWYDPFAGGTELSAQECETLFARFHPSSQFDIAMLTPITPLVFAQRMLANLKVAYLRTGDLGKFARATGIRAELPGALTSERVDYARTLAILGRNDQAAAQYEMLVDLQPEAAHQHQATVRRLHARRN